jgi:hypothetical protein
MLIDSPTITGSLQVNGESIDLPSGGDSQRPSSPVTGSLRYNTDSGSLEIYDGIGANGWAAISSAAGASSYDVDFLVLAGGAGGGKDRGGGGGAGGLRTSYGSTSGGGSAAESSLTLTGGQIYTITVGGGGGPASYTSTPTNGSDSSSV